jgi:hypothetical protein
MDADWDAQGAELASGEQTAGSFRLGTQGSVFKDVLSSSAGVPS